MGVLVCYGVRWVCKLVVILMYFGVYRDLEFIGFRVEGPHGNFARSRKLRVLTLGV